MLPWSQIVLYFVALSQIMLQHMLVISYDSAEQRLISTVQHFRCLWNVAVTVAQSLAPTQERVESFAISSQTESGPCRSTVHQFGQHCRREDILHGCARQAVLTQHM